MVKDNRSIDVIKDLNLDVKFGEIFGIIGVDSNWQSEFVELLTSIRKCCGDEILFDEESIKNLSSKKVIIII